MKKTYESPEAVEISLISETVATEPGAEIISIGENPFGPEE